MDILKAFNVCGENYHINIKGTADNPLFQANQIGKLLEIKNIHESIKNYDKDEKDEISFADSIGRIQQTTFLTEFGLYKLLFKSTKPIAKTFQKWVFNVIKELRENGKYETKNSIEIEKKLNDQRIEVKKHETLINSFKMKHVIYLTKVKIIDEEKTIIKIGFTNDIEERNRSLFTQFGKCIFQDIFECYQNQEFELFLKRHPDIIKCAYRDIIYNDNKSTETYLFTEIDYNNIIKIIQKNIVYYQGFNPDQYIEMQKVNLEFAKVKLNTRIVDLMEKSGSNTQLIDLLVNTQEIEEITDLNNEEDVINITDVTNAIINKSVSRKEKVEKLTSLSQFKPRLNTRQRKIQQYDKNTFKLIKTFDGIMDVIRTFKNMSKFGVKHAAENNTEYYDFRWFFIAPNAEHIQYRIPDTVEIKSSVPYMIAKLDKDKIRIENVFLTLKDAAENINISRKQTILDCIVSGKPYKNLHIFMKYNSCSEELKNEYLSREELPTYSSFKGKAILQLDSHTHQIIKKYDNIYDVLKHVVISRQILKKACDNNEVQNGFRWKYV